MKFACEASGPGLLFVGSFFSLLLQFHYLFTVYSGALILPDLVLEDCMFLGIYPFHPGCPLCWHIVVHNIFLQSFVFLWCQLYFSFISDFTYLGPFSSFLDESGYRFVNLVYLFKELVFGFTDLLYHFLDSISFISALIFIISFLLLTLGFVVLFQVPLSVKLDCLFELFLFFFFFFKIGL